MMKKIVKGNTASELIAPLKAKNASKAKTKTAMKMEITKSFT